jgi:type II secretory pathway pseudopilin PulG
MKILKPAASGERPVAGSGLSGKNPVTHHSSLVTASAFTLVEIAISLAIIGIALVAIIGVLPRGLDVQRENRERTVINQDATIFMEAIRNGAQGADDLTNYVYRIEVGSIINPPFFVLGSPGPGQFASGADIIGLLTTPNSTNHAYVRSISGPAVEKPPQDNPIIRGGSTDPGDTFAYRLICENIPVQTPGQGGVLAANLHELRLTFLWPILPGANGTAVPARPFRQTFRTLIAGKVTRVSGVASPSIKPYFFQSQSFTNAP